jgi:hypothetical protein
MKGGVFNGHHLRVPVMGTGHYSDSRYSDSRYSDNHYSDSRYSDTRLTFPHI